jgi:hypothetical protein
MFHLNQYDKLNINLIRGGDLHNIGDSFSLLQDLLGINTPSITLNSEQIETLEKKYRRSMASGKNVNTKNKTNEKFNNLFKSLRRIASANPFGNYVFQK